MYRMHLIGSKANADLWSSICNIKKSCKLWCSRLIRSPAQEAWRLCLLHGSNCWKASWREPAWAPYVFYSLLYGFNQFVGHTSQRVPDVPKFSPCHTSQRDPDERSEFLLLSRTLQARWRNKNFVGRVTVTEGCRFDWNPTVSFAYLLPSLLVH